MNQITGRVIAVSDVETITPSDPSKQPLQKRRLLMDCTRYDPNTGEKVFENTPMLEFGGKSLEKLEEIIKGGLKKDSVVTVAFDVVGRKYTDKNNRPQVFTTVRPYSIEMAGQSREQAPAPQPAPQPQPMPQPKDSGLPF